MGLFGFGKKKEKKEATSGCGCSCGSKSEAHTPNTSDTQKSCLIVLGACCEKSSKTFENVKTAAAELGLSDEVLNIGDMSEIASYGVMSTPALVIDGKVVSFGKLIHVNEAKEFIQKAGLVSTTSEASEPSESSCGCAAYGGGSCCSGK